jgi:hypothetical protein
VVEVVPGQHIVLRSIPDHGGRPTVWTACLVPHWDDQCRLLIRGRTALRHPGDLLLAELAGPAVAVTVRGVLRGIKRRAEHAMRSDGTPGASRVAGQGASDSTS